VNTKLGTSPTVEVAPRPTDELGIARLISAVGALPAIPKCVSAGFVVHFCPKYLRECLNGGVYPTEAIPNFCSDCATKAG
jgi:hypothetical protein